MKLSNPKKRNSLIRHLPSFLNKNNHFANDLVCLATLAKSLQFLKSKALKNCYLVHLKYQKVSYEYFSNCLSQFYLLLYCVNHLEKHR